MRRDPEVEKAPEQTLTVYGSQVNGIESRAVITFNLQPQINTIHGLFNLRFH
jgi:hypothetical protein